MPKLIDLIKHEHNHLTHFFEDINDRFYNIEKRAIDEDFLEDACSDLRFGIEEMLHHFDQEEEILFEEILKRLPQEKDSVDKLIRMHEFICDQTQELQGILEKQPHEFEQCLPDVHDIVATIRGALRTHARRENEFFQAILQDLKPEENDWLLSELSKI